MYRGSLQEYRLRDTVLFYRILTATDFSKLKIVFWRNPESTGLENDHKLGSMLTVWVTVHFYDGKVIFADQLITHWHHIKRKPNLGIKRFIFLMVSNAFNSLS